jgi:hypothetical protein
MHGKGLMQKIYKQNIMEISIGPENASMFYRKTFHDFNYFTVPPQHL